jgi:hypothetical protein
MAKRVKVMLYGDPKIVKRDDVLHGEFSFESRYGVLQKRCARI